MGRLRAVLLLFCTLLTFPVLVAADDNDNDDLHRARILSEQGAILPLNTILQRIGMRGRRLLEVELEEEHGKVIYEMELLDQQRHIYHLEVDAKTGKIIKRQPK